MLSCTEVRAALAAVVTMFGLAVMPACSDPVSAARPLTPIPAGISPEFPYQLRDRDVRGAKMRYVDQSTGDLTFVLLHGNPTSSYLWRNIIPHLERRGRVIAPDMMGMGASDKPDIAYTFRDHAERVEELLVALAVDNVVLVVHDWGGPVGFHYARHNPQRIRGLVFFETFLGPFGSLEDHFGAATNDPMVPGVTDLMTSFRSGAIDDAAPGSGWDLIVRQNMFVEQMLPLMIATRQLTPEEHDRYRAPFLTERARLPVFMWPREIPVNGLAVGGSTWGHDSFAADADYLSSTVPKLYFFATPGSGLVTPSQDQWARALPNTAVVDFGPGTHFLQEDDPHRIGVEIVSWAATLIR